VALPDESEEQHESPEEHQMSGLLQDVRYALRQLRKNPGFTLVAALILALGIGGVTAMFSTAYAVMIRPLPYFEPDRLVLGRGTYQGVANPWLSGPDYVDYRDKSRSFSALETFFVAPMEVTVTTGRTAERVKSLRASTGLLTTLGVNMALGRPFTAEEGRDGGPLVAIVSNNYWQKHFAAESGVAGHSVAIDGELCDVVGVTPPGFQFNQDVDVWLPMRPHHLGPRRFNNWFILGRLKTGVTLAEAQSEVDVIAAQLEKAYPDTNAKKALLLTPLQSAFTEQYHYSLGLLCGGAAAILLIAWANAAGLLLARGAVRRGELAVRAVMGASHWRMMRLLLAEALILAGAAAVMGVIVAAWMQNGLLRLMPLETLFLGGIGISWPALLFVLGTTVLTWLGFGLVPAWQTRNLNLAQGLRSSGRGALGRGVRLRNGLVAGQIALSLALLVVAGLLLRSLDSLHRANPGFNAHNLLTVEVPLPAGKYSAVERPAFFASLLDDVRSMPGVVSAAAISQLPLRDPFNDVSIYAADNPPADPTKLDDGYQRVVLPGYFQTMGIPVLAGRDIQPADTAGSRRVVVVSRQLANTLFPKRNPIGQKVVIDRAKDATWEIVGVVSDVKQSRLREETSSRGTFYRAHAQQPWPTMRLAIRTSGNPLAIVRPLRALLQRMDPAIPLSGPRTMEEIMANGAISETAQAASLTAFSVLALILAAVGIYGLLAYVVTQRTGEFGIRLALGAQPAEVVASVLRDGLKTILLGGALGVTGAVLVTPLIASELYGVRPLDLATFIAVTVAMLAVSIAACLIPARRASRVDPMVALRHE
jgi:putative ABC transport system permease protein